MDRVEEKLRLLKPVLHPSQWNGLRIRYIFESDFRKRQEIESMLDMLIAQHVPGLPSEQILLPPPDEKLLNGDYPIGDVIYPEKSHGSFGIRQKEWIRHCGIFGKTGSGKTTLAMNIIRELCRKDHPFLIFDYKRNYRDLLKHPDFKDQEILIFTVGRNDVVPFFSIPNKRQKASKITSGPSSCRRLSKKYTSWDWALPMCSWKVPAIKPSRKCTRKVLNRKKGP
jgi:hypothetical protein